MAQHVLKHTGNCLWKAVSAIVMILLFAGFSISNVRFYHVHVIDGKIVAHSHPFSGPVSGHSHTPAAAYTIALMSESAADPGAFETGLTLLVQQMVACFFIPSTPVSTSPVPEAFSIRPPPIA